MTADPPVGRASPPAIAIQLRDPDAEQRIAALIGIGQQPETAQHPDILEALTENLGSENKSIQRHTVNALAAVAGRHPAMVSRLAELLAAPAARTRWGAAYALGLIDGGLDLRALAPLLDALADGDGDIRWAAMELLVKLGRQYPTAVRGGLLECHHRTDENSVKMSLYALRDLGFNDPEVCHALRDASASPRRHVRLAVLSVLRQLGADSPESVEIAMRCLQSDPDAGVRRAAASTLGYLKNHSAPVLSALREAANSSDDASLRKAALAALAQLQERK